MLKKRKSGYKKKILITGGFGYIGSLIAEELANYYDVYLFTRRSKKNTKFKVIQYHLTFE